MLGSVAVADVPDSPLSTIVIDQVVCSTTAGTGTTVCLNALHGDALKKGVAGIDAVVIEEGLCHGEVAWFHVLIIRGRMRRMGQWADTLSGVTVTHAMGSPLAGHFQITMGSPYFANHTEQRR